MKIRVLLSFHEGAALRLLNWLAEENALIHQTQPDLPLLYDSGVVYVRDDRETWSDYLYILAANQDDCDGLAAARAGELLARGSAALAPGDEGYEAAQAEPLPSIPAEVMLLTLAAPGETGLYHCIVRYRIAGRWYRDDPSARLGMNGAIDRAVQARWAARGLVARRPA